VVVGSATAAHDGSLSASFLFQTVSEVERCGSTESPPFLTSL
jgi:hypothetical protein